MGFLWMTKAARTGKKWKSDVVFNILQKKYRSKIRNLFLQWINYVVTVDEKYKIKRKLCCAKC